MKTKSSNTFYSPHKKKHSFIMYLLIIFLMVFIPFLFSCNKSNTPQKGQPSKKQNTKLLNSKKKRNNKIKEKIINIAIQSIKPSSITERIRMGAQVTSLSRVNLTPNAGGTITSIIVKEGDFVRKNTTLLYVDSSKAGKKFLPNPVRTPIDGIIASLPLGVGNTVTTATPVVVIVDSKKKHVTASVSEKKVLLIKKGLSAIFHPIVFPTTNIGLTINEISSKVSKNHLGNIILTFKSPQKNKNIIDTLLPGMYGALVIDIKTYTNKIVVDSNTIVIKPYNGQYMRGIFTVDPSEKPPQTTFNPVTTGIEDANKTEITSGIKEGDFVITEGQTFVFPNTEVTIMKINGELQKI